MDVTMRIVTYNVHKGFSLYNMRLVLDQIKTALVETQADILFLQEVRGTEIETQFEFIADQVWSHYAYGKNAVYDAGHHGNAILSHYPIIKVENLDVSNNRFERRGILHAEVDVEGRHLHLLCVHFDLRAIGRQKQLQKLIERILSEIDQNEPVILAGDFNDWGGHLTKPLSEHCGLKEVFCTNRGVHAKTFPAVFPFLCLDRIYVRGLTPRDERVLLGMPWRKLSDHSPLQVDVDF